MNKLDAAIWILIGAASVAVTVVAFLFLPVAAKVEIDGGIPRYAPSILLGGITLVLLIGLRHLARRKNSS